MLSTLLNLDGDVAIVLEVLGEPDGREVAPAELLNDDVAIEKDLADMDWVVPSNLVVGHSFVFTRVLVIEERIVDLLLQGCEVAAIMLVVAALSRVSRARLTQLLALVHPVGLVVHAAELRLRTIALSLILLLVFLSPFLRLLCCLSVLYNGISIAVIFVGGVS